MDDLFIRGPCGDYWQLLGLALALGHLMFRLHLATVVRARLSERRRYGLPC